MLFGRNSDRKTIFWSKNEFTFTLFEKILNIKCGHKLHKLHNISKIVSHCRKLCFIPFSPVFSRSSFTIFTLASTLPCSRWLPGVQKSRMICCSVNRQPCNALKFTLRSSNFANEDCKSGRSIFGTPYLLECLSNVLQHYWYWGLPG